MTVDEYLEALGLTPIAWDVWQDVAERHRDSPLFQRAGVLSGRRLACAGDLDAEQAVFGFAYTETMPELDLPWWEAETRIFRLDLERQTLPSLAAFCVGGSNILEVGCGPGIALGLIACTYPDAHVTGIDISPGAIALAGDMVRRLHLRNVRLCTGDFRELANSSELRFDRITARTVFAYHLGIDSPRDWVGIRCHEAAGVSFRALRDLLAPQGRLWFSQSPFPEYEEEWAAQVETVVRDAGLAIQEARSISHTLHGAQQNHHIWILARD